jgi:predicted GIY-YIG superfamily endonuclease
MRGQRNLRGDFHVYYLIDDAGEIVYVGVTSDIRGRFRWHVQHNRFWSDVKRIDFTHLEDYTTEQALLFEALEIRRLRPKHNHLKTTLTPRQQQAYDALAALGGTATGAEVGRHMGVRNGSGYLPDLERLGLVEEIGTRRSTGARGYTRIYRLTTDQEVAA